MATISSARAPNRAPQPIPVASVTQNYDYTCNTCQVAFRNGDLQRTHMRNDWHRYNLKRRVASLPPVSSEVFAEKVLTNQASSEAKAAKASFQKPCTACQKTYYSENAYQNHLGSQKHRLRLTTLQHAGGVKDPDVESVISSAISLGDPINAVPHESVDPEAEAEFSKVIDGIKETKLNDQETNSERPSRPHHSANDERPQHPLSRNNTTGNTPTVSGPQSPSDLAAAVPLKQCLFCNYESPTFKLSVMHMTKFHGLFIPEQPYLVDLEGLIAYLYAKISELHECLYCHKIKGSKESIQTHMRDKGHCMIAYTSEAEMIDVGLFYDFRSSYSDPESDLDEDEEEKKATKDDEGGVKLGKYKCLKTVVSGEDGDQEMQDGEENAGGWETDTDADSILSENLGSLPIDDRSEAYKRLVLSRHHSHFDPRHHHQIDGYHSHAHSHHAVFKDDYELHLPSGRTAGHRSLKRYYRQNLHSYPSMTERLDRQQRLLHQRTDSDEDMEDTDDDEDSNVSAGASPPEDRDRQIATRANTAHNQNLSMVGVTEAKGKEVRATEKRGRKEEERGRKRFEWGVNKQGNNQKHFRDPLLQ
ncbi:MAG: hypothetical protein Q9212_007250 [Teloschistes hypoglaucus]